MSHQRVLEASNAKSPVDTDLLAHAVSALGEAQAAATACADACLLEDDPHSMQRCITLDLDTADIAAATSRVISRLAEMPREVVTAQLAAACTALETCASECEQHEHDHCSACADACRSADEQLHELIDALG